MPPTLSPRRVLADVVLAGVVLAGAATALFTPAVSATASPLHAQELPPGVVKLNDGEPCPPVTLCLYRDYGRKGPAYGIGAGYDVELKDLPIPGGSMAKNVSSWVNNTHGVAFLIAFGRPTRPLPPGQSLEEPPNFNDSVDVVAWRP